LDKTTRNKVLSKIPYGLYVVGSNTKDGVSTIIANWISQVSFHPPLVAIAVEYDSDMRDYIEESKFFSINMLAKGSTQLAKAFLKKSKQSGSMLNGKEATVTKYGTPYLKDSVASIECKVVNSLEVGDHVLFVGEVIDAVSHDDGEILTLKETGWKYSR